MKLRAANRDRRDMPWIH